MLVFVGIARFYGREQFGQFTIAHTYLTIFFLVADFGFDLLTTINVARNPERTTETLEAIFPVKLVFSASALVGMVALGILSNFSPATKLIMLILSVSILGNATASFCFAIFRGHEQLYEETKVSFYQNLFLLVSVLLVGFFGGSIFAVATVFASSRLFGAVLILIRLKRVAPAWKIRLTLSGWKQVMGNGLPFGFQLLFGTLYFQLDTLLLASWKGDNAVGVYQAAMKLVALVLIIPDVIVSAVLPVLSRYHSEGSVKWETMGGLLAKTLLYMSLPIGLTFYFYADQIIQLVYGGHEFSQASLLLRIFAFVIVIRFSAEVFALMLTTSQQQGKRMIIVIAATLMNFALNTYAIPRYGLPGAALVSLITNIAAAVSYVWAVCPSGFCGSIITVRLGWVLAFTMLLAVAVRQLRVDSVFLGIPLIVLFSAMTYIFVGYSPKERSLVFSIPKHEQ